MRFWVSFVNANYYHPAMPLPDNVKRAVEDLEKLEFDDHPVYVKARATLTHAPAGPNGLTPAQAIKQALRSLKRPRNRLTVPANAARLLEDCNSVDQASSYALSLCYHAALHLAEAGEIRAPNKSFIEWELLS